MLCGTKYGKEKCCGEGAKHCTKGEKKKKKLEKILPPPLYDHQKILVPPLWPLKINWYPL